MWSFLEAISSRATHYDWLLLFAAVLVALYIYGTWHYDYFASRGFPATKPTIPFWSENLSVIVGLESMPDFAKRLHMKGKGHAIFGTFDFRNPVYMVREPEMLKIITVKEFDHFMNHRNVIPAECDPIFDKNLFSLKDQRWKDMRTTLSPAFTTSKIKGMFSLVSQCAQQMVDHLRSSYEDNAEAKNGLETDMKDLFTRMGNDVIASVAFGLQCDSLKQPNNEFFNMGKRLTNFSTFRSLIFFGYMIIPKIIGVFRAAFLDPKAVSYFCSMVHETIRERQKRDIFRADILQLLMQAREGKLRAEKEDQHESENISTVNYELTDEDVSAQAIIFFFAGFETVSVALCFTSYQISHHPEIQERLQKEIDDVWERSAGQPTYEDVQGMKYLDAVISEALRMHPPNVVIERECREDVTLPATASSPPIAVRKGQYLFVSVMGLHYDEDLWPEPERFDPERFSDENRPSIKPYSYMPFGQGPRICIGQRFALIEVKLALLHLLRHFDVRPSPKTAQPLQYEKGFAMSVKGGFWSFLTPRNA